MEAGECNGFDRLFQQSVPHILERIFFHLDYESFKACYDVCKVWKILLSSQTYHGRAITVFGGELLKAELYKITYLHCHFQLINSIALDQLSKLNTSYLV